MDWPRAKTLLIIALVLLNAFLYYHAHLRPVLPAPEATYLTAVPHDEIADQLAGYGVQADLPQEAPPRLPSLVLAPRPQSFEPGVLLAGEDVEPGQGSIGPCTGRLYTGEDHILCLSDDGWVVYGLTDRTRRDRASPSDLTAAQRVVEAFLDTIGGLPVDVQGPETIFDRFSRTYVFRYEQVIEDAAAGSLWIFPGAVEIHATAERVVSYRQRLWDVRAGDAASEPVMPVTNLIQRQLQDGDRLPVLLELHAASGDDDAVLRARLGYALGPRLTGDHGADGAILFEGRPAWQVTLEGALPLLFDARSGQPIEDPEP